MVSRFCVRGLSGVSPISGARVVVHACVVLVAADGSGVVEVSAAGFVSGVPCSNEHIRRNSLVKTFLSESRWTRASVNVGPSGVTVIPFYLSSLRCAYRRRRVTADRETLLRCCGGRGLWIVDHLRRRSAGLKSA